MRRAVAIRTYGDPEIGDVLKNALVVPVETDEMDALRKELREMKEREAKFGVREVRDKAYFANKMLELEGYGTSRQPSRVAQEILLIWAIAALVVEELFRRLDEWVMNSARRV